MPYEKEPKKNPSVIKSVVFDTETASDNMKKAYPNTGRSMSLPHDLKVFVPNCRLYNKKKTTTVQCIPDHFSTKKTDMLKLIF